MTETALTNAMSDLISGKKVSGESIKGYLYMLPGASKGFIIQNRPDFRITAVLVPAEREITTNYNRGVHRRQLKTPHLLLSQLFLKNASTSSYLSLNATQDYIPNCSCDNCKRVTLAKKTSKKSSSSEEFINHHPACGCFYCKLDRVDNHRQFFIFAWDNNIQDKILAQPYRISNVYQDGRICFRKDAERRIQIPLTLREANSTFWSTAFDPDFVQARAGIPHICAQRTHAYPTHRHLCRGGNNHLHDHPCGPTLNSIVEEQRNIISEIGTLDKEIGSLTITLNHAYVEQQKLLNERANLTEKEASTSAELKRQKKLIKKSDKSDKTDVSEMLYQELPLMNPPPEFLAQVLETRLSEIKARSSEFSTELTEVNKKIEEIKTSVSKNSETKEQFSKKYSALDRRSRSIREKCHCCQGSCLCSTRCPCCNGNCKCFEGCACPCCKSICGCACACDLSVAFADYVASYTPPSNKWENFTSYFLGDDFYSSSKNATAVFIAFKRDLESFKDKIPESYYRTTPKYDGDPFIVGAANLNDDTGIWSVEIDKDLKLEFPFDQLRMVR